MKRLGPNPSHQVTPVGRVRRKGREKYLEPDSFPNAERNLRKVWLCFGKPPFGDFLLMGPDLTVGSPKPCAPNRSENGCMAESGEFFAGKCGGEVRF